MKRSQHTVAFFAAVLLLTGSFAASAAEVCVGAAKASLTVDVTNVFAAVEDAARIAEEIDGRVLEVTGKGNECVAMLRLQVAPEDFPDVLGKLAGLGRLTSATVGTSESEHSVIELTITKRTKPGPLGIVMGGAKKCFGKLLRARDPEPDLVQDILDWADDRFQPPPPLMVRAWTNHERVFDVFHNDDRLIVNLRPNRTCYIRVYYISADGSTLRLFPALPSDSDILQANKQLSLGDRDSHLELIVSDDTIGQEFIKIFASVDPIDDSTVPVQYLQELRVAQVSDGYPAVLKNTKDATGALLKPIAEIKLLIQKSGGTK